MAATLSLQGLRKTYGPVVALGRVSLEVEAGEFLTLLGPSGCGKTTLLRLIAGFESPDEGRIRLGDRDLTGLPPYRRPVNTVFQHYALFPHLSVAKNVAFGLEMAGRSRAEIEERVPRALEQVRLRDLGARRIDQLSGGQRQRVALARALVLEPEVLLLDEPLGALDRKLREEMQLELRSLHRRLGRTFVFVTHDQEEALALSDRVVVMNGGRIEQLGAPGELYERPATRFVADFLGVRNLLEVTVRSTSSEGARLATPGGLELVASAGAFRSGERVWIGIRAERLHLSSRTGAAQAGCLEEGTYLGERTEWRVRVGGEVLTVSEAGEPGRRRRGDEVEVDIPADAVLRLAEPGVGRNVEIA
jgi:spermidine/putrescine transport system ATP-binding protein